MATATPPAAPDRLARGRRTPAPLHKRNLCGDGPARSHQQGRKGPLIEGLLVTKMNKGPSHVTTVENVVELLKGLAPVGYRVRQEAPIVIPSGMGVATARLNPMWCCPRDQG